MSAQTLPRLLDRKALADELGVTTLDAVVAAVAVLKDRHARSSFCTWLYFIQAGEGGAIKIGSSDDPLKRMSRMQVDNAATLHFVAVCRVTRGAEEDVHEDLHDYRIRGEWFEPAEEVFVVADAYAASSPIAWSETTA